MAVTKVSRKSLYKNPMTKSLALTIEEELTYYNYKHLKVYECKRMPDRFYFETTQENVTIKHREEVINRLLHLSDDYKFVPETIFSAVGYMDRYLSINKLKGMEELLLVGLSCFIIAAKEQQSCLPSTQHIRQTFYYYYEEDYDQLGEFTNEQLLLMEEGILRVLNNELTTPSAKDFLKIFVEVMISKEMKGDSDDDDAMGLKFRYLTDYILELYLLDYTLLGYSPSIVAASAIFLGKFILWPSQNPWNSALKNLTAYEAWELRSCSEKLLSLYCKNSEDVGAFSAVKKKYSKREYSFAANIGCSRRFDPEFF